MLDVVPESLQQRVDRVGPDREIELHHRVLRQFGHERRQRRPGAGHVLEDQGFGRRGVVRAEQARHRHAAVAFAADHRLVLEHGFRHVRLAHRRPHHAPAQPRRDVIDAARGGDVGDDRAGLAREGDGRRQQQRDLLRQRGAVRGDEAETFAVRVVREADIRAAGAHDGLELRHVHGRRFGPVREGRAHVVVDREHGAAELLEPPRDEERRRAVAAVDGHAQAARADGVAVERRAAGAPCGAARRRAGRRAC